MPVRRAASPFLLALALAATASATIPADDRSTPISASFPSTNGEVRTIAVVSDEFGSGAIYIGGSFTEVGGTPRNHLAAFDIESGVLTAWNPDADGPVNALVISGNIAYVGGDFAQVGGQARSHLAAVSLDTGSANDWNPAPDGEVSALAFAAGNLHVGGTFSTVGGALRTRLAAFDSDRNLLPWNPAPDGDVRALLGIGSRVYVGGDFQTITGSPRSFAAAVATPSGSLEAWNPAPNGTVRAFSHDGASIFVGGDFTEAGGRSIAHAVSTNATTGAARAWDARVDGPVHAFHYFLRTLYVGGDFAAVGGFPRARLASIDSLTAAVRPWNPGANAKVQAIWFQGGETEGVGRSEAKTAVLIGGPFSVAGGATRQGFAALRDPMWSSSPRIKVSRINGKRVKNLGRTFYTKRNRVRLSGTASSHTDVDRVIVRSYTRGKKAHNHVAHGTTNWKITLRLRGRENAFLFRARDKVYDFPLAFISYSVPVDPLAYVARLDRGEQLPRR